MFHFLSPEESHGLDHKSLGHFLTTLSERTDMNFGFSYFDIDNIRIKTEVSTSNGGRVDAVMWVPETWFICWELKVYASESGDQTVHYVEAESFPTIDVHHGDAPMTRNYVYPGRWFDDFGVEMSETFRVTTNGAEVLAEFPRELFTA
nr:PD-(D/E)XK nuclease family protein [Haladaptatus halobius]